LEHLAVRLKAAPFQSKVKIGFFGKLLSLALPRSSEGFREGLKVLGARLDGAYSRHHTNHSPHGSLA